MLVSIDTSVLIMQAEILNPIRSLNNLLKLCMHVCRTGLGDERNAMSAFLFTFPSGDTSQPAEKLVKVRKALTHTSSLIGFYKTLYQHHFSSHEQQQIAPPRFNPSPDLPCTCAPTLDHLFVLTDIFIVGGVWQG